MIQLTQTVHNLIGSEQDIKALENKESARLLILSDSHGKNHLVQEIIERYGPTVDAVVFCGDGAVDIAMVLGEAERNKKFMKAMPPVMAIVQGNGDSSKYTVSFGNKTLIVPGRQIITANHKNFLVTHGHREGVNWGFEDLGLEAQIAGCNYAFYGHTHITAENRIGEFTFVNPGSCSRPRGGQPACFAIATVEKNFVDIAHIKTEINCNGIREYHVFTPIY